MYVDLVDDVALTLYPRLGPGAIVHLLECFTDAKAIFNASVNELVEIAELREDIARELSSRKYHYLAEKELKFCRDKEVSVVTSTSGDYPELLRECRDYPHVLYVKGDPDIFGRPMLSMVGTRSQTAYGRKMCEDIIGGIAELFPEVVIVSGLAYGTDGMCHRVALSNGLVSVGVMATPVDRVHPVQHTSMAMQMVARGGALVTECHSYSKGNKAMFIARNRIIAAMTQGTVVIESASKGGSMTTANLADGYERCVMAVPGRIGDEFSTGTNLLIKSQKARLVTCAKDIAEEMGWEVKPLAATTVVETALDGESARVIGILASAESISIDELSDRAAKTVQELYPLLLELELAGHVRVLPGNRYQKR